MNNPVILASAYNEAATLVSCSRRQVVNVEVLWKKLNRVEQYLQTQAAIALHDTLN